MLDVVDIPRISTHSLVHHVHGMSRLLITRFAEMLQLIAFRDDRIGPCFHYTRILFFVSEIIDSTLCSPYHDLLFLNYAKLATIGRWKIPLYVLK